MAPPRLLVALDPLALGAPPPGEGGTTLAERCRGWAEELGAEVVVARAQDPAAPEPGDFDGVVVELPAGEQLEGRAGRTGVPVVGVAAGWIDEEPPTGGPGPVRRISGRGDEGVRWGMRHLVAALDWPPEAHRYGDHPSHRAELRIPPGPGPHPVAVLLHGGWWRSRWGLDLMDPLAVDLARRGWATWNVEYRRTGPTGGGWPATALDVALALDHLSTLGARSRLDTGRLVVVGHSVGAQLALWAAARRRLADGLPGSGPEVVPAAVVGLAPVCDLLEAEARGLGAGAVGEFLGGPPAERPEAYRLASPQDLVPLGVPQLLVHGGADESVPVELTGRYAETARRAGDRVEVVLVSNAAHRDVVEASWPAWPGVATRIDALARTD